MALQYVGGTSGVGTSTGYTVALSGALTGGTGTSPQAGDLVVVVTAFGNTASSAPAVSGNNSGAYTAAHTAIHANDTYDTEFRVFYKVMPAVLDTSLTITRVTNAAYGGGTVVHVWRNVDPVTPLDVTPTTASGTNASTINPPAITPVTAGAVILACGAGTQTSSGSAFVVPSGMSNGVTVKGDGTTSDIGVMVASYDWTSGAYNPAAVTGGTTSNSCSWAAATLAIRPYIDPNVTLTPTGQEFAFTLGTPTPSITSATTAALIGQDLTFTQGIVTPSIVSATTVALTGQALAFVQGTPGQTRAVTLTGQSFTFNQGTPIAAEAVALTGQSFTFNQGTPVAAKASALTGQSFTFNQGSPTALITNDSVVALTGQTLAVLQGSFGVVRDVGVTGQALTILQGAITPAKVSALTGQALAPTQGAVGVTHSNALAGQALTIAQGTAGVSKAVSLAGQSLTMSQGTVGVVRGVALVGQPLTLEQGSALPTQVGAAVTAGLTGQVLGFQFGAPAGSRSIGLAGAEITFNHGTFGTSIGTAVALSGQGFTFEQGAFGPLVEVAPAQITGASRLMLADVWQRLGLNAAAPATMTATTLVAGSITQTHSEGGATRTDDTHAQPIDADVMIAEIYRRMGLDAANPLVQSDTQISAGSLVLALTGDGNSVTVTRQ